MSFYDPRTGSTRYYWRRIGMHHLGVFPYVLHARGGSFPAESLPEHDLKLRFVRNQGTYIPALGWVNCFIDERFRGLGCGCGSPVLRHRCFNEECYVIIILLYRPPDMSRFQFHTIPSYVPRRPMEHSHHVTSATLVSPHALGSEKS